MDESNMHSRKRKRPSHHTNGENHQRHHTSHQHKHKPTHIEHHRTEHPYSVHSHQVPRAHHTRRQDNGESVGLQATLSVNVPAATSVEHDPASTAAVHQSAAPHTSNPATWLGPFPNSVFYEASSQQVMSPPPTPVPGSSSGGGSFHTSPAPTAPVVAASSSGSSQTSLGSGSYASMSPPYNATASSSTLSSSASASNSLLAANSSTSTGSTLSASTSHTPSTTIYSSGVPLVPVFTTALRIPIPLTSQGRTVGTTFSTSYHVSYSTLTPSISDAPVTSARSNTQIPSSGAHTRASAAEATTSAAAGNVASNNGDSSNNTSVPTPTVVGGVVGGVAGLAVFLLLALLILRWYKRRRYGASLQDTSDGDLTRPHTAEAATAGAASAAGGLGLLRRLSRRVGPPPAAPAPMMREIGPGEGSGSFQRIAGRKLPSQFSPGIEGPGPGAASASEPSASYPSGSSGYPSGGTFASSAMTPENPFSDPYSTGTSPTSPQGPTFPGPADLGAISGIGIAHGDPSYHRIPSGGSQLMRPSPARTPTMVQAEDNRASSHFASRSPSPGPSLDQHPALRPSGAYPSPFFGAAGGGSQGALSPNRAVRGRGYGSIGIGRGSPGSRASSGSRFVEGDL